MKKQSFSGFIRQHLTSIESKLEAGFSHQSILEEFALLGFVTSIKTFRNAVYRARRRSERREKNKFLEPPKSTCESLPSKSNQMLISPLDAKSISKPGVRSAPGAFRPLNIIDIDEFKIDLMNNCINPLTRN